MTDNRVKIELIFLSIVLLIVGAVLAFVLSSYLTNKNQIEARDAAAKCIATMKQASLGWDWCLDIANFDKDRAAKF